MAGVPPKKNAAYTFECSLVSQADTDIFQTGVTLVAGDVTTFRDGALIGNIGTLPTEIGATGVLTVSLTAAEMNADRVVVRFHDQADDEWQDLLVTIETVSAQIDDLVEDVWSYAIRTLTSSSTAPGVGLDEQVWTVLRGDTLERTFADIAADGSITKCQLTVKVHPGPQPDSEAILAIDSTTGLIRLNGAAAGAYTATFSIVTGELAVPALTMAQLDAPKRWHYDVQVWRGAEVETIEIGRFVVVADVTRLT